MASHMRTPGRVGRPGKWPAKKSSSPVRRQRPEARRPGSSSVTSSTNRNGGRCGITSAGRGVTGPPPGRSPVSGSELLRGGQPLTASLSLAPAVIFTARLAGTAMVSPVRGLRPVRAALWTDEIFM